MYCPKCDYRLTSKDFFSDCFICPRCKTIVDDGIDFDLELRAIEDKLLLRRDRVILHHFEELAHV